MWSTFGPTYQLAQWMEWFVSVFYSPEFFQDHLTLNFRNLDLPVHGCWMMLNPQYAENLLYFELSPPWHLYVLLLANLLAFYLTYLLAFYLAYLLAFYLAYLLAFYLAYLLAFYLAYHLQYVLAYLLALYLAHLLAYIFWHSIWQIFWHMFWQTFWHFIWHTFWHSIWHIFWHSIWQTFWHFIWHIFWHSFWHSIWRSIWHIFWHSIWPLRSSGAHWARRVPGWGPAVLTELGGSQVEVQRCSLSSDGPRLRSSGAHCAQTLVVEVQPCPLRSEAGSWGPAVPTARGS